jgi:hypothetical protein
MKTNESLVSFDKVGDRLSVAQPLVSCAALLSETANEFLRQRNYAVANATLKIVNELMEIANATLAGESVEVD